MATICAILVNIQTRRQHLHQLILISNVTSTPEVRSTSARLFAGKWHPLVSVVKTLYYVAIIFHRRVWYRALSLCYVRIRSSGIILIPWATFVPNLVSFTTSTAELAHGEKLHIQSLTHSLAHLI